MLALDVQNLVKTFKNHNALDGMNLQVPQGSFFGLLGLNGAGKSTFIKILASLLKKTSGSISIMGKDFETQIHEIKPFMGFCLQENNLPPFETVLDAMVYQAGFYGVSAGKALSLAEIYLKKFNLWNKRYLPCAALSGGMKRSAMLVKALIHKPSMLILDELTAGIDLELRHETWKFLKQAHKAEQMTIILTSHHLDEIEFLCDQIAVLHQGKMETHHTLSQLLCKKKFFIATVKAGTLVPSDPPFPIQVLNPQSWRINLTGQESMRPFFIFCDKNEIQVESLTEEIMSLENFFMNFINQNKI